MDGLKQVMAVKSRVVLPYLVPKVQLETNFRAMFLFYFLPDFFGLMTKYFEVFFQFYAQNIVTAVVMQSYLKLSPVIDDLKFIPSEETSYSFFIFYLFIFLADYSPREYPCASFPLISSRGCSDKALECHPACYDVCTEREAGD